MLGLVSAGKQGSCTSVSEEACLRMMDSGDSDTTPAAKRQPTSGDMNQSGNSKEDAEKTYFKSYSDLYVHEEMLRDVERTSAYLNAIMQNKDIFREKVILDVGAGTGILSCFCAKAGAKRVYAIEGSDVAQHARTVIAHNNMSDCVTLINEKVENCELPEKVDVIVSEWMGYCLVYESMLPCVLHARDRWLRPGGLMFPSHAALFAAPISQPNFWRDRVEIWSCMKDEYGVDMSCLSPVVKNTTLRSVQVVALHGEDVLSESVCVFSLNLGTATVCDLQKLEGKFSFKLHCQSTMHGMGVWFVVTFPGTPPTLLSTSPYSPATHWRQCVLFLDSPADLKQDDTVDGSIVMEPFGVHMRFLAVHLQCDVNQGQLHIEKDFTLDDNTC